jgi:hypothetical protein
MSREDRYYRAALGLEPEVVLRPKYLPPAPTSALYRLCCLGGVIGLALIDVLIVLS